MVCAGLETLVDNSITGILAFPTSCDYYFYLKIMVALFIVLTITLWRRESDKFVKSDFVSSMGVSAIAVIFVSLIGTTLKIIQQDVFITLFVGGLVFIVLWLIKK